MKLHTTGSTKNSTTMIVWDSITGPKHEHNEDKAIYFYNEYYALIGVFDGVGSAKNNMLATKIASDFITTCHTKYYRDDNFHLEDMVIEVNETILSYSNHDSSALATCAICVYVFSNNKLTFLTLGDTRIYAIGKHYINKLTQDDVAYPGSNIITKCLGIDLDKQQISQMSIDNFSDNILVCSDGFYKLFEETKITFFDALNKTRSSTIKSNLANLISNKHSDDATYILFKTI